MFTTSKFLRLTFQSRAHFDIKQAQAKWQKLWQAMFNSPLEEQPKFYCLVQFPYPSGKLHLGHARVYFISDTIAHFNRLKEKYVIHPIGWDSFGLPAENAAITHKVNPLEWTEQNIQEMKQQLLRLGVSFDWQRELATHKPDYYKWTQTIFLKLYEAGLAYKKEAEVNWDPVDKTVLANEQVDANGNSWRSGAKVEKKVLSQWFFKITAFAKQLQNDLLLLPKWPDRVKEMQSGWIGAKDGHIISFTIIEHEDKTKIGKAIQIFTTRAQTIMGCTFLAVPETSKSGRLLGYCQHPLTKKQLPIYEADFVLENFGTGAIMGVPAHNDNDQVFAAKHNIPIQIVLEKHPGTGIQKLINSGEFTNLELKEARELITQKLINLRVCTSRLQLHLKDWLVSRQRYWGAPIPMIYCKVCGVQPVSKQCLPILLPRSDLSEGNPLTTPLYRSTTCPKCNGQAQRETDTLDTFVDSSWYYLRYLDPHNSTRMFESSLSRLMPADVYIGGIEHAIMHLLYARFIYKFLRKQGLLAQSCSPQPFEQLIVQGLVKGKAIRLKSNGKYLTKQAAEKYHKDELEQVFEKMSKSKFNGVNPTDLVEKYGCDSLRMAMMFSAPVENDLDFKEEEVQRMEAFLKRVIQLKDSLFQKTNTKQTNILTGLSTAELELIYKSIQLIQNMESILGKQYTLHVYSARIMEFFNLLKNSTKLQIKPQLQCLLFKMFVVCMVPLAPHVSYQILSQLSQHQHALQDQIIKSHGKYVWPKTQILKEVCSKGDKVEVSVSINNKFKSKIRVDLMIIKDSTQDVLIREVSDSPGLQSLKGQTIKKVIVQNTPKGYILNILITK